MTFAAFVRDNGRWIVGGLLLTYFSSFGQTLFISLSAGHIREEYGLSNGQFGTLYMVATLGSALTLPRLGQIVDRNSASAVVTMIVPVLALAAVMMALSRNIALLLASIYLLRLFGQGMMTHAAFTLTARWFSAQRGRAISVVTLGLNAGEATYPSLFVALSAVLGWRNTWLVASAVLVLLALPLIRASLSVERKPRPSDPVARHVDARDWTRAEVVRDPVFYMLLLGVLAPGFIATTIYFHQVYLVVLRGWSMEIFAASFGISATMTVIFALLTGQLIDRFSGTSLLPGFLIPLAAACFLLGLSRPEWTVFAFMALLGISNGFSSTLLGAIWPEIYGTRHLGSIRALTVAIMVFGTAMGPGITGFLIDRGVSYPAQIVVMGVYCLLASGLMVVVARRVKARNALRLPAAAATHAA